jgi:hypothetical protein
MVGEAGTKACYAMRGTDAPSRDDASGRGIRKEREDNRRRF